MVSQVISLGFLSCAFMLSADVYALEQHTEARHTYSASQYLKNYALSVCLGTSFNDKEIKRDMADGAQGYIELGSFPIEIYEEAFQLSKKFVAKKYEGKNGEKLSGMKCIDFFHSKELEQLAKKAARQASAKK